jgi:GntR family transcriptional repressor for pyruvate dehydrogenase complex
MEKTKPSINLQKKIGKQYDMVIGPGGIASLDVASGVLSKGIQGITPLSQPKMAERIVASLVDYISSTNLEPGHKLPSEKELSKVLQVGNRSLREALMILQALGLVQSRHGAGWFIEKFEPSTSLRILSPVFEKFGGSDIFQILDTRLTIEPQIAYLAAENISEEGLKKLSHTMDEMNYLGQKVLKEQQYNDDYITYGRYDQMFHNILALECKNNILAMLSTILSETFDVVRFRIFMVRIQEPLKQHQAIHDTICARDSRKAEQAMRFHIEDTRELFIQNKHLLE